MDMADNVQPDAGEEREASASGLLLSTDPLQDSAGYKLSADDDSTDSDNGDSDNGDDDYDSDNGDSDGGGGDDSGPIVVEIGPGASDRKDSDSTDESDPDYSDN
jgi:hypothetical protein